MKDPQIILSTVLAIATIAYTIINALMLSESIKVRKQKNSPLMVAFLDYPDNHSILQVHIKNIGEGCARNVKIKVLKDYNQLGEEDSPLSACNAFKNGVNIFPPQHEQIYYLGNNTVDVDFQSDDRVIELEIECKSLTNNKSIITVYNLPFNQIGGDYSDPPSSFVGQIPYYLKKQINVLTTIQQILSKKATDYDPQRNHHPPRRQTLGV